MDKRKFDDMWLAREKYIEAALDQLKKYEVFVEDEVSFPFPRGDRYRILKLDNGEKVLFDYGQVEAYDKLFHEVPEPWVWEKMLLLRQKEVVPYGRKVLPHLFSQIYAYELKLLTMYRKIVNHSSGVAKKHLMVVADAW